MAQCVQTIDALSECADRLCFGNNQFRVHVIQVPFECLAAQIFPAITQTSAFNVISKGMVRGVGVCLQTMGVCACTTAVILTVSLDDPKHRHNHRDHCRFADSSIGHNRPATPLPDAPNFVSEHSRQYATNSR